MEAQRPEVAEAALRALHIPLLPLDPLAHRISPSTPRLILARLAGFSSVLLSLDYVADFKL